MRDRRETTWVAGGLLALLVLATAMRSTVITRALWLDEVHTLIVASRATPAQVISDVAAGIDTAPGLLHLALWGVGKVVGLSPFVLHAVPFVLVWIGLVLVFATLRRRFDLAPSLAGTLAVMTHQLVIQMTYEARFYGPWLAVAALFAWAVGRPPSRARDWWVALSSVLICTIHWFGVISLAIMCAAVFVASRRDWRASVRNLMPAAIGIVALLLCAPILLGQRAAVTAPTWIPAPDSRQIWTMAKTFYVALVPVFAAVIVLASWLRQPVSPGDGAPVTAPAYDRGDASRGIAALAALALMPVALLVVSYVLQPTLLDRYATVATLAWAPLVAYAAQVLGARGSALLGVLILGVGVLNFRRAARGVESFQRGFVVGVDAYRAARDRSTLPIVFQSRHVQFQIVAAEPLARERSLFLALPDSTLDAIFPANGPLRQMGPFFRFEREAALLHERVYGIPRSVTQAQLDTTRRFLLVGSDLSLPAGYKNMERWARAVFPHHDFMRVQPELTLYQRR